MGLTPVETATSLGESYSAPVTTGAAVRSRARAMLTWVPVFLVFVITLELACRVEDWVMYRTPLLSQYTAITDLVIRDADGMHGRPNARFQKWIMNGLGLRGPAASPAPASGTVRIITVGASETFGLRESPAREYPRQLEDSLNARGSGPGCAGPSAPRFEVLNAGFAGMALPTIDQDIRLRLRRYRPAIIVVYPTPAQYLDDDTPFAAMPDSTGRGAVQPLLKPFYPRVAGRIRDQIKQILPEVVKTRMRQYQTRAMLSSHPSDWRWTSLPTDRLARYDHDLRGLIGTIRAEGAIPVLATHGNMFMSRATVDSFALISWEKFYPRATGATIVAFDSAAREITLRVGADSSVRTVDAAMRLAAAPASVFGDFVHFTDVGASLMADVVRPGVLAAAADHGLCELDERDRK